MTKAFMGAGIDEVLTSLRGRFAEVRHFKPKASRQESSETYLVATGFRG